MVPVSICAEAVELKRREGENQQADQGAASWHINPPETIATQYMPRSYSARVRKCLRVGASALS